MIISRPRESPPREGGGDPAGTSRETPPKKRVGRGRLGARDYCTLYARDIFLRRRVRHNIMVGGRRVRQVSQSRSLVCADTRACAVADNSTRARSHTGLVCHHASHVLRPKYYRTDIRVQHACAHGRVPRVRHRRLRHDNNIIDLCASRVLPLSLLLLLCSPPCSCVVRNVYARRFRSCSLACHIFFGSTIYIRYIHI